MNLVSIILKIQIIYFKEYLSAILSKKKGLDVQLDRFNTLIRIDVSSLSLLYISLISLKLRNIYPQRLL
jgi:hypothetical protein